MRDSQIHKIGSFTGLDRGILVILIGGIHGNEPAGVKAIRRLLEMLEEEPSKNPNFRFKGKVIGIQGNIPALQCNQRYIDQDLNRLWEFSLVDQIKSRPLKTLNSEERQLLELEALITTEIEQYAPEEVIFMDIHTTTATGGIFTIVPDSDRALEIAARMQAPVIRGMNRGIQGTTMDYFVKDRLGLPSFCLAFEAGQHQDPKATDMAIAGIVSFFRAIGSILPDDVESRHDQLLKDYSSGLPHVAEMIYKYEIMQGEHFHMQPGYTNFQQVKRGEVLARNEHGQITAETDGLILMPHYQEVGIDGFFIIKKIEY